jgi:ribosomal protection tetracycline resistance protein
LNKTIGILAHVDAGKTTLSEQILYHTHSIRTRGRVDHQDAFLDSSRLERERGITIFSDQAVFHYQDSTYYLVDTPGHVDFSAEMERTLRILDYAIVVVSCAEGVQAHTETIWKLLRRYRVPTLFFLNKTDRAGARPERVLQELRSKFSQNVCDFIAGFSPDVIEQVAELDDVLLELYLNNQYDADLWRTSAQKLIQNQKLFPCFCGSALNDIGIDSFLQGLDYLTKTDYDPSSDFAGRVYKIRHDAQGSRVAFLKITNGTLHVKEPVGSEKINEIRVYNGAKYTSVQQAQAGELCAVTGLSSVKSGDGIGALTAHSDCVTMPMLMAKVNFDPALSARTVLGYFKILEDEDPMLGVVWEEALQELHVHIMGTIQLEVLKEVVQNRFGIAVEFGACEILYKETIQGSVIGYGHFEPLRHYAEVHLRLSAGERGSGLTFSSECSTDVLDLSWQRLIRTHVFEFEHKGILTGSPLTDVKIALLTGRAHEKHTEGGDFREATYRAIRQGLEQADNLLLEPFYAFSIEVEPEQMGRVLADIQRMYGSFAPPETENGRAVIHGRAPVAAMMNYGRELVAFTKGKGSLNLQFDGYEPCHNPDEVIARFAYDKIRDVANTSDSVFCSHGTGFNVKWDEVKNHIHCK